MQKDTGLEGQQHRQDTIEGELTKSNKYFSSKIFAAAFSLFSFPWVGSFFLYI